MPQSISLRRPRGIGRIASLAGGIFLTVTIVFFSVHHASAQRGVAVAFLPDASASMDVREAASQEKAGEYQLYVPSFMAFSRLPKNFNGAIWLKFTLGPSFENPADGLRADFGSAMPGLTRIYIPQGDDFTTIRASSSPIFFTLPDSGKFPETFYARLDGTPGLWFRPVIAEADTAKNALPAPHLVLAGLFGAAMLLLLLQYLREAKEWRLWAAITAGCGIVAALLPSAPAAGAAYTPLAAAGMLMPGLIIAFFAHTARHLFNAPKNLAGYDAFLAIYYVLGAAIALFPLIPGFLYVSRYLPLSYAVLLPLLFIAMAAIGRSLKGAAPFLCACLLVTAGVIGSAWELTASGTPFIGGFGGLAGLGLGLALLGLTGPSKAEESTAAEEDVFDSLHRACRPAEQLLTKQLATEHQPAEHQPAEQLPAEQQRTEEQTAEHPPVDEHFPLHEEKTNPPHEEAADKNAPLAETPPPPGLAALPVPEISLVDELPASEPTAGDSPAYRPSFAEKNGTALFDLPMLVKNAYDDISPLAEKKNLGMSWFIAPQTGRLFKGDKALLDSALRLLLRDMAGAIDRGNVRLTVRRLPDSKDAGHIVFTFTEWDARKTFYARNMAGLSDAWALAEQTGGIFSVEHSPTNGASVIFSSVFTPMDAPKGTEEKTAAPATPSQKNAEPAHKTVEEAAVAPVAPDSAAPRKEGPEPRESVHKFTDHPDIILPEGLEAISAFPAPAGLDGEDLAENAATERTPARIIIADITASGRSRLRAAFADSPYSVLEGASPQAACALYKRNPSALVIMSAAMPEADIAEAIRDMHAGDANANRTPVLVLTIVEHEAQAERMTQIGCAKTLMKPLADDALLLAAQELAPLTAPGRAEQRSALPEALPIPAEALEPAARLEPGPGSEPEPAADPALNPEPEPAADPTPDPALSPEIVLNAALNDIPEKTASAESAALAEAARSGIFSSALPEEKNAAPNGAAANEKKDSGRGLGLIDMIVTDEEEDDPVKPEAPATAKPPVMPEMPEMPEMPAVPATPEPETPKPAAPKIKTVIRSKKIVKKVSAPSLNNPEPPADAAPPATALVMDDGRMQNHAAPSSGISIRLPGEEDGVFKDMIPLIPGLIHELTDAMEDAAKGREQKSPMLVQEAAERVAGKAETFGLARLERMARCVERAAAADDVEPMECVLDDLANWVERYKEALSLLHREHKW